MPSVPCDFLRPMAALAAATQARQISGSQAPTASLATCTLPGVLDAGCLRTKSSAILLLLAQTLQAVDPLVEGTRSYAGILARNGVSTILWYTTQPRPPRLPDAIAVAVGTAVNRVFGRQHRRRRMSCSRHRIMLQHEMDSA